jgi:hypothetical protein
VRVGQRIDEVRGGQVGGQLGYDHGVKHASWRSGRST